MNTSLYKNEVVWIIGASSGIGAALSKLLANCGARLALSARRENKLLELIKTIGTDHKIYTLDVTSAESVKKVAETIVVDFGRVDRIIFLAAAYTPMKIDKLDLLITKQIIDTNLLGALYVVDAVLPILNKQEKGQIALCGSVAGYLGLPGGQPYSATKAALINLAESLRAELPLYIDVKIINPGFVESELTNKNDFKMPMIIPANAAAEYIVHGLIQNNFEIHFPKKFTLWLKFIAKLPYSIIMKITRMFH